MNVKLTDELRQALEANSNQPVAIEDEQSRQVYYLLREDAFLHLQGLQAEHEHECHERLRHLIDEGIRSPGVPAQEAFTRLRAMAEELSRTSL